MPDDAAGQTLHFPTIQTCEAGETAWIAVPSDGQDGEELATPAPSIVVVEAPAGGDDADETDDTVAITDGEDDDSTPSGLAVAGLVAGLTGVGLGGVALSRRR